MRKLAKIGVVLAVCSMAGSAWAMTNPATMFCIEMGGKPEMLNDAGGAVMGVCKLPDGTIVEEWTLFRLYHDKVPLLDKENQAKDN
jgi:putative hemolysin